MANDVEDTATKSDLEKAKERLEGKLNLLMQDVYDKIDNQTTEVILHVNAVQSKLEQTLDEKFDAILRAFKISSTSVDRSVSHNLLF